MSWTEDKNGCGWKSVGSRVSPIDEKALLAEYGVVPSLSYNGALTMGLIDPAGVLDLVSEIEAITHVRTYIRFFESTDRQQGEFDGEYFILAYRYRDKTELGVRRYYQWALYQYQCMGIPAPDPNDPILPHVLHKVCPDGRVLMWYEGDSEPVCPTEPEPNPPEKKAGAGIWIGLLAAGAIATVLIAGGRK